MVVLLDTHTILWYAFGDTRLSTKARSLIDNSTNERFVSIASPWEVTIKVSTGKLRLAKPVGIFFSERIRQNGLIMLPITPRMSPASLPCYSITETHLTEC